MKIPLLAFSVAVTMVGCVSPRVLVGSAGSKLFLDKDGWVLQAKRGGPAIADYAELTQEAQKCGDACGAKASDADLAEACTAFSGGAGLAGHLLGGGERVAAARTPNLLLVTAGRGVALDAPGLRGWAESCLGNICSVPCTPPPVATGGGATSPGSSASSVIQPECTFPPPTIPPRMCRVR